MFRLLATLLGRTAIPPTAQRPLYGVFDWRQDRVTGWVSDPDGPPNAVLSLAISRKKQGGNIPIAETSLRPAHPADRNSFVIPVGDAITAEDLLKERIEVTASNADGTVGQLRLDGAKQVQLIKQGMNTAHDVVADVDFTRAGNSQLFPLAGFSEPGENLSWAIGTSSEIRLPGSETEGSYALRMLVEPFLSTAGPSQLLTTTVNGVPVGETDLAGWHPQFLEYQVPFYAIEGTKEIVLSFSHPNAVVPAEYGISAETRALAIAFMRLTLVRLLAPA